jgi:surface polysaccharide O-acyltransferase-like enzyme
MLIIPADISMSVKMLLMGTNSFSGFVGYFLLGYYFEKYDVRISNVIMLPLGLAGIIIANAMVVINPAAMEDYMRYYMPTVMLYGVAIYLWIRKLAKGLQDNRIATLLGDVGARTLGIYMLHMPVIILLEKAGIVAEKYYELFSIPVLSLAVLLIAYGLTVILRRIPVIKHFV